MTEEEARERIEVAFQLEQLTQHPGWPVLRDFVQSRAVAKQNRLLTGSITHIEEYKKEAGWLAGANDVLQAPETAEKMALEARRMVDGGDGK